MNLIPWLLIVALIGSWAASNAAMQRPPAMHMIDSPRCFPARAYEVDLRYSGLCPDNKTKDT